MVGRDGLQLCRAHRSLRLVGRGHPAAMDRENPCSSWGSPITAGHFTNFEPRIPPAQPQATRETPRWLLEAAHAA